VVQKVLFVDDDEDIRTIAHLSLMALGGWQVVLAASGPQAIETALRDRPDVIILDVMMPGMTGIATLERLRNDARTSSIPVIFMTAKVQKSEVDRYHGLGVGVIAKPFDPMRLSNELCRVLGIERAGDPTPRPAFVPVELGVPA
jgi:two-component system OmpR family response regulator